MGTQSSSYSERPKPENLPEQLVWYHIVFTYPLYFLGAQYISATLLASFLSLYVARKWWHQDEKTPLSEKISISLPTWVWIAAVLLVAVALVIGHADFDLGITQIAKSLLGWYRSWGLLALFLIAGHLRIRPLIVYRAVCIICFQSLIAVAICWLAQALKFPVFTYVSPLRVFGGIADSYAVFLFYVFDEWQPRLQLFAPWPPALGLVGNVYFFLAAQESNSKWRCLGMIGAVMMVLGSVSRLSIVCLPIVAILSLFLTSMTRPLMYFLLALVTSFVGISLPSLVSLLSDFRGRFDQARSGSSVIRARLREMTREAWINEAAIWGHGRLEPEGPSVTAFKPLGSHHFWYGLLYSHGLVGFFAVLAALTCSFIDLLIKSQFFKHARASLRILTALLIFSFAENLEGLVYVFWPGVLIIGTSFRENLAHFSRSDGTRELHA